MRIELESVRPNPVPWLFLLLLTEPVSSTQNSFLNILDCSQPASLAKPVIESQLPFPLWWMPHPWRHSGPGQAGLWAPSGAVGVPVHCTRVGQDGFWKVPSNSTDSLVVWKLKTWKLLLWLNLDMSPSFPPSNYLHPFPHKTTDSKSQWHVKEHCSCLWPREFSSQIVKMLNTKRWMRGASSWSREKRDIYRTCFCYAWNVTPCSHIVTHIRHSRWWEGLGFCLRLPCTGCICIPQPSCSRRSIRAVHSCSYNSAHLPKHNRAPWCQMLGNLCRMRTEGSWSSGFKWSPLSVVPQDAEIENHLK